MEKDRDPADPKPIPKAEDDPAPLTRNGIPLLPLRPGSTPVTPECVQKLLEEDLPCDYLGPADRDQLRRDRDPFEGWEADPAG